MAFSPDGRLLATASATRRCGCGTWPPASRTAQPLTGHTGAVTAVAFSPDGTLLATASADGTVRLWDVATGQPHGAPLTGHTGAVYGVAFSPDGALLATAGADGTVRLWDMRHRPAARRAADRPHRRGGGRGVQPGRDLLATASTDRRCGCGT